MASNSKKKGIIVPTRENVRVKTALLIVLALFAVGVAAPQYINKGIEKFRQKTNIGLPKLPESKFNLGLDLQGGAHLIYEADTSRVVGRTEAEAVEGVRDIVERRVRGSLGVTEPLVQTTKVGNKYRIIVELPGITDVNQAIKLIGETPVLDFKEENSTPPRDLTPDEKKQIADFNAAAENKAKTALAAIRRGTDFASAVQTYSEDEKSKAANGALGFVTEQTSPELYAWAAKQGVGAITLNPIKLAQGYAVVKKVGERNGDTYVTASHLLLCYKGATNCTDAKYTKEEAKAKIDQLKQEATVANFATLVKTYSTEPSAATSGGDLGSFKKGQMVPEFENAVFGAPNNTIIGPVETQFGYHLIYKKSEEAKKEYDLVALFTKTKTATDFVPAQEQWQETGLSGALLKHSEVATDQRTGEVQVSLQFNDEGTKLFGDITTKNVGKQVAIFLDGQIISQPRVSEAITSGSAVINGTFTLQEAKILSQRLNSGALPVPIEVIGQEHVDATLGLSSLKTSFEAGLAGLALVMLFMIFYYRLPGVLSVVSLLIYTALNLAFFKLSGVTLTLSGIAGFILSIGMAVDANVLVFERLKEELRLGKRLKSAMEESFARAWPSIRDGHVTTLISCFFLMWFGSGFVKGFAVVLATGTLMSLFTAVTVTRTIMRLVFAWFNDEGNWLFLGQKSTKE